jgi:hypothetical protein
MSMVTAILAGSGLAGALCIFLFLRSRSRPKGDLDGSDTPWTDRLTERFPMLKSASDTPAQPLRKDGLGLQGNLAQTPLHDLLQYLSLGRKSGILEVASGRRTGRMVLRDGRIYKNSYRGKEGLEAIFLMLDLPEGDFEFYEQVLEDAPLQPPLEVVDIIMIWMDRKPKKKQASG